MLCSHKIDEPGSAYKYCKMPLLMNPYFVKKSPNINKSMIRRDVLPKVESEIYSE